MEDLVLTEHRVKTRLVKVCPQCNREFAADDPGTCCPDDRTLLAPVASKLTGTLIDGRYQIESHLSTGGWGEVFLGRHVGLNRAVAIKVLHLNLVSDPERVKHFQCEAEAASKLKHNNIVSVHDYGLTEDGRPFIVMDYIEGRNLTDVLRNEPLTVTRATRLMMQLCDALLLAHQQGIIHRDIKPGNIMLTGEGGNERALLLDFGIAKTMHTDESRGVTRTGEVLGTPAFMSPEQCRGQALDCRSDVYSLGCVFYEMLFGRPLVSATNTFDYMNWHLNGDLPSMKFVDSKLSGLEAVLKLMLAKIPDERYQSIESVRQDLENIQSGTFVAPIKRRVSGVGRILILAMVALSVGVFAMYTVNNRIENRLPSPVPPAPAPPPEPEPEPPIVEVPVSAQSYSVRELNRQLGVIEEVAGELRQSGNVARADWFEQEAKRARDLFQKKVELPSGPDEQVMVVGVYEGSTQRTLTSCGLVEPKITYTAHPITLVLSSYSPVIWQLNIAPGVKITRIIMFSFSEGSSIKNPPKGVSVEKRQKQTYLDYEYNEFTASHMRQLVSVLGKLPAVLVGCYDGKDPIELGSGSSDFLAQQALNMLSNAYKQAHAFRGEAVRETLESMRFWGVSSTGEFPFLATSICQMNGLGPTNTKPTIEYNGLTHVALDPVGKVFYGITNHELFRIPMTQKKADPFITNPIEMHWLTSITYDTKRKHAIVSADGNSASALFLLDPAKKLWSVLRQTGSPYQGKYASMFYDESVDKIYAIPDNMGSGSVDVIAQLNAATGVTEKLIQLNSPLTRSEGPEGGIQLFVRGNLALVLVPPQVDHNSGNGSIPAKVYLYDLLTGKLIYSGLPGARQ